MTEESINFTPEDINRFYRLAMELVMQQEADEAELVRYRLQGRKRKEREEECECEHLDSECSDSDGEPSEDLMDEAQARFDENLWLE
jgi:hypothetical protein